VAEAFDLLNPRLFVDEFVSSAVIAAAFVD
jgi:hypothetical protein